MNSFPTCFEIVRLAFKSEVSIAAQIESMKQIGRWASSQPGFLSRQSYHDPQTNLWTDIVEWQSELLAHEAMERSLCDPSLGKVMSQMSPDTIQVGHFQRHV